MQQIVPAFSHAVVVSSKARGQHNDRREDISQEKMEECLKDKPYQILRPLMISMSLFGLIFINSKMRPWYAVMKAYSTVVLMIIWANFIRVFLMYTNGESLGPALLFKITHHCWSLLSVVCVTTTYKACQSDSGLTEFLVKWSRLLKTNRACQVQKERSESRMKRTILIFVVVGWLLFIINGAILGYAYFRTDLMDFNLAPVAPNADFAFSMKCIVYVVQALMSAIWIFTLCLFLLMSSVIYLEFELLQQDFRKAISPDGEIEELEYFRGRHQEICHLVEASDDILNVFNAAAIVVTTASGMLVLYNTLYFISRPADIIILISCCFWLVLSLLYLTLVSYGGGHLNHAAHAPLKIIHDIRLKEVSTKLSLQMNMFLAKLTGESIGLTAMDMFVIDKPTILTIAGAFVTYFIVLIQFQQPSSSPATDSPACNATLV